LGLTLCKSGNIEDGGIELRKALSLNPDDREVVKALSIIDQENEKR
jgi:Flp pilus assembly protein TadD